MDDRIRDELGGGVESYVPSPGLPERIEARTRQRERNRVRLLVGAAATSVALVAGLVLATQGGGGRSTTIASGTPLLPSTSAAPLTTTPAVRTPVSVATPAATAPQSFLAAVGGGNEQAVIVDTASGHVTRTLTAAPPGQELWAVSVDGRTLYAPTQELVCARKYVAVDTATGAALGPAFAGLSDLQAVAPSPDGQTVAYTTGCAPYDGAENKVYLRRPDLSTTTLATGGRGLQMSWSGDGSTLAIDVLGPTRRLQLWDIGPASASGPRTIAAPDAGCELVLPRFAGNQLFATEECPASQSAPSSAPKTVRLLLLDTVSGTVGRSWTLASAPYAMAADLAVDPTGGWALYSLGTDKLNGQVSLLALSPAAAKPRVLLNDAFEVAWLPATTAAVVPTTVPVPPPGTGRSGTTAPTGTTVPPPTTPTTPTSPTSTPTSMWRPSCSTGAPTTPYFPNGCILPDGSIQPPP